MADKKTKLELTWIGKEQRPRLEPRILLEDPELSYAVRKGEGDIFDNMLIHGDNLLALKALEQEFAGRVRCVFIDPPYNTGAAFAQYDDGLEHSIWLSLMRDRLDCLHKLMAEDGSIWIAIDDNEAHYLKVLCDEMFGRRNFVASVIWQKNHARNNSAQHFSADHDFILVYAKDLSKWRRNRVSRTAASDADFWNPDDDPRGEWRRSDLTAAKPYGDGKYEVFSPGGDVFSPRENRWWGLSRASFDELAADGRIWWGKTGRTFPFRKRFRSELGGLVPTTVWLNEEVGNNREAKQEITRIFGDPGAFATPKPERLLERIIAIASDAGDIILDSFAGSGTTGAVAHKMGRRWIMAELGAHCSSLIAPRLRAVVGATDSGGMGGQSDWKGGGGFRFYRLAPSLLEKDKWGNYVIAEAYRKGPDAGARLAEAMCKLEGFTYAPSPDSFWIHGTSTEHDYIYVTTQTLGPDQLRALSDEVGPERSLLICCGAHIGSADAFDNLTLKKIPTSMLSRCEWGRDDYSLNVSSVMAKPEPEPPPSDGPARRKLTPRKRVSANELPLFTAFTAPEETK